MQKQKKKRSLVLGLCVVLVFCGAQGVHATTGRIDEFRTAFREAELTPTLPRYLANVSYPALLAQPHPDEFYSYAKDHEVWTAEFLSTLRASGEEAAEFERWIGDPILVVLITDFDGLECYSATFSLETGEVKAEYLDTKSEIWCSLTFVQELLVFADQNTVDATIEYAVAQYYSDWSVWVEQGFWDILLTREAVATLILWAAVVGAGGLIYKKRK